MVIFSHVVAAEDNREEVRGGVIHLRISHGRRSFITDRVSWIRSLERKLQWRKRMREGESGMEIEGEEGEKLKFKVCLTSFSFIKVMLSVTNVSTLSLAHGKLP